MLVPLSWLRDFAPFGDDAKALAATFDSLGMVVEGINHVGGGLDKVVVGRVLEVAPIEKARVRRTRVDLGDTHGRDVQIVCGAPNVEAGQLVPVAVVGAVLPGDFEIAQRTVRGVESNGMICSPIELAMGSEADGIWVLPDDLAPIGTPFAEAMDITPDVVFDLAIEGNRPDANCIAGVARDAAAALGLPFTLPEGPDVAALKALPETEVRPDIQRTDMCPRFTATIIEGVKVGPSPEWMARRLNLAGMRPISNLVDISNYVMLELGQPTHPYDADRIPGGTLGVRAARAGEELTTLDDVTRTLGTGDFPDCVITDGTDTAVGLGGVMGGASSEIHAGSTRVYFEAAHFDRMTIARTSKRLALRSEASSRFERGVDPLGIEFAVARFVQLAGELAGGRAVAFSDVTDNATVPVRQPIITRVDRVGKILGTPFTAARITELLLPIGFTVEPAGDGVLSVTPPSYRMDCEIEEDIIEEVARHHGYVNLPRTTPRPPTAHGLTPYQRDRRRVREVLCGLGLSEAVCSNLVGPGDHARVGLAEEGAILAADPMAREESVLRRSLRPGLLEAVVFNLERRADRVRLFEIGHTFERAPEGFHRDPKDRGLPDEKELLGFVIGGEGADAAAATQVWLGLAEAMGLDRVRLRRTADIPGTHTTRTARILGPDGPIGAVGEIDPAVCETLECGRVGWGEIDLRKLLTQVPRRDVSARPVSRFPSSDIDLAFAVPDNVAAGTVQATLTQAAGPLAEWVELFDVYRGEGLPENTRSLAFRIRFVAQDHTLTDAEVATARQKCIDAVERGHHSHLRA